MRFEFVTYVCVWVGTCHNHRLALEGSPTTSYQQQIVQKLKTHLWNCHIINISSLKYLYTLKISQVLLTK